MAGLETTEANLTRAFSAFCSSFLSQSLLCSFYCSLLSFFDFELEN